MHYIMENPASAPAYFALFQTVNGSLIFNPISNPDDIKFVGAVATAWDANYPGTSRTENLHNIAIQGMKNTKTPHSRIIGRHRPGKDIRSRYHRHRIAGHTRQKPQAFRHQKQGRTAGLHSLLPSFFTRTYHADEGIV